MLVAYRGFSVILCAPICALIAVVLALGPQHVLPFYSHIFMVKLVGFVQLYFPVFLLGAVFGKLMELTGSAQSISQAIVARLGSANVMLAVVLACAILTYGGVSLFVVAFAVYPLAADLFRKAQIPKRLVAGTIALGSFTFTMDALPGTPQIQNVIPTTFFGTDLYAAPILGCSGAFFVLCTGLAYLSWQRKRAQAAGETYQIDDSPSSTTPSTTPATESQQLSPAVAVLPLLCVGLTNFLLNRNLPQWYGPSYQFSQAGLTDLHGLEAQIQTSKISSIWSIEIALCLGILTALLIGWSASRDRVRKGLDAAVAGAMLATLNTASEYGFGGVIASLPGFAAVKAVVSQVSSDPLINQAVSINLLAGVTGSASGGMSLALGAMGQQYLEAAKANSIDPQVLHRIASMASGGMDTLPHNGAVITLLLITGLTHREAYKDIFVITIIKTCAVFVVIALYRLTGLV